MNRIALPVTLLPVLVNKMNFKNKTGISLAIPTNKLGGKMSKAVLMSGLTAAVLMSGLVGCNNGTKKIVDRYNPQEPTISRANGSVDVSGWASEPNHKVDLQNGIDMSNRSAKRVIIAVSCARGEASYSRRVEIANPGIVKVYSILPENILIDMANPEAFICSFILDMYNDAGSNHTYNFPAASIVDNQAASVQIATASKTVTLSSDSVKIGYGEVESTHFSSQVEGPGFAHIVCTDINFPVLPFNQNAALRSFDQSLIQTRPGKPSFAVNQVPEQTCRILIRQNSEIVGISALFKIEIVRAGLKVSEARSAYDASSLIDPNNLWGEFLSPPVKFRFSTMTVTNESPYRRLVKVFKTSYRARTMAFDTNQANVREGNYLHIALGAEVNDFQVQDLPEFWIITLPSNASFSLIVDLTNSGTPFCMIIDGMALPAFVGLGAEALSNGTIEELNEEGNWVRTIEFSLGPKFAIPRKEGFTLPGSSLLGLIQVGCGL